MFWDLHLVIWCAPLFHISFFFLFLFWCFSFTLYFFSSSFLFFPYFYHLFQPPLDTIVFLRLLVPINFFRDAVAVLSSLYHMPIYAFFAQSIAVEVLTVWSFSFVLVYKTMCFILEACICNADHCENQKPWVLNILMAVLQLLWGWSHWTHSILKIGFPE